MSKLNPIAFAGNDYLGLARDPRLAEALARTARDHGISPASGRFFLGWSELHKGLERELAEFFGAEEACLLPSAYLGGLTFFSSLAAECRVAFCDEYAHLNLLQGMRAGGCEIHTFRHLDAADLQAQLRRHKGPPPAVVTDGVFSLSGELAPVRELAEAARKARALLLVDDAHGVFCTGRNGRGTCELSRLDPNECVLMGSMSKALGCHGGFFVGRSSIIRRLQRGTAGATPSPMPVVAACREALRIVRAEPERRERMARNRDRMLEILRRRGVATVSERTPILAMRLRNETEAKGLARHFESQGIIIRHAKYPSEPRTNLLRSVARAVYTEEDLDRFRSALDSWRRRDSGE
jgi:7-keto-8-aminopelargonate synthetase-like enzyme